MKKIIFILGTLLISAGIYASDSTPLWLRKNSISPDGSKIAFSYQGDIYVVDSKGGKAEQITINSAYDTSPLWTPDGENIVFSSYREQSRDIYIVPCTGGKPRRITDYPGNEYPLAILKDGRILFSANIQPDTEYINFPGNDQLYIIGQEGGRPERVTSLTVLAISVNKDGLILYEDYKGYEDPYRKHHTSSVARDIWLYAPAPDTKGKKDDKFTINENGTFTKLSTFEGEDRNPVFASDGDTFYFLSEMDGTFNIYKSSISSPDKQEQLTFEKGNPVRFLSVANDNTLAYSYDGELYTLKEGGKPEKVNISLIRDNTERELSKISMSTGATDMAVSPDGKELAIILRGDVYVTSTEYKTTNRITNTPEQERDLYFSKDGRTLYYSSERDGHWGIYATSLTDKKDKCFTYAVKMEEKRITDEGQTCFQPKVSPDGKLIAYLKDRTAIAVRDLKNGKEKIVLPAYCNYSYIDGDQSFAWSPDSKYILSNYQYKGGWNNEDVALINVETGEITDLTESGYSDTNFKWALDGNAMTWQSDKAGYRSHGSWGSESDIYLMFFDGEKYKEFRLNEEDEAITKLFTDKKEEKKESKDSTKAEKEVKLNLDLENRYDRIIRLTRFSGVLGDHYLTKDGSKLYYVVRGDKSMDLCRLDIKTGSTKVISKGISGTIYPAADGKYFYILCWRGIYKVNTSTGGLDSIAFNGDFEYQPAKEREYIFEHVWKQVNEKFYDPQIHGIDWAGYRETYRKFLPYINNNFDFQELLSEMLGELNGSHTGARYYYKSNLTFGTLGVIFDSEYDGDGLKIKEIIKGGPIYKSAPDVQEGDVILAVNGNEIKAGKSWYKLFESKAGSRIMLTIKKKGKKEEDIFLTPASNDRECLYNRWVRRNAEKVKELSHGRLAYVHVRGMDSESFRKVYSDLLGKYRNCEAVIVDTRHNGGGWLHDDLATLLSGKAYIDFEPRGQYISTEPYSKWTKPSCVLIGEDNYSDASGFPYVYKTLGIGKLIGAPVPGTMTAVWWETQIDESLVFGIPQVGSKGIKEGRYLENYQIEPDILVYNDPASVIKGEDKQLEAAVEEMLKEIDNK